MSEKTVAEALDALGDKIGYVTVRLVEALIRAVLAESLPAQPKAEAGEPRTFDATLYGPGPGNAPSPERINAVARELLKEPSGEASAPQVIAGPRRHGLCHFCKGTGVCDLCEGSSLLDSPKGLKPCPKCTDVNSDLWVLQPVHPSQEQPAASGPGETLPEVLPAHTCVNAGGSLVLASNSLGCEACQVLFQAGRHWKQKSEEFLRGRAYERWLQEEAALYYRSCGRDGFGYPDEEETTKEVGKAPPSESRDVGCAGITDRDGAHQVGTTGQEGNAPIALAGEVATPPAQAAKSGGAPSDDELSSIATLAHDVELERQRARAEPVDRHATGRALRRALFEAGAASREAEVAAYERFFRKVHGTMTLPSAISRALVELRRELAALEAKGKP